MPDQPKPSLKERRKRLTEDAILDAAELLINQNGGPDFSMRALAAEAGVGFTTPFTYFGTKLGVMFALAHRVARRMRERYEKESLGEKSAPARALVMARCGVGEILRSADVSRAVIAAVATYDGSAEAVGSNTRDIWRMALGDCEGLQPAYTAFYNNVLPDQLALAFRGALTYWGSGDLQSEDLLLAVTSAVGVQLFGFVDSRNREFLLSILEPQNSLLKTVSTTMSV